MTAQLRLEKVTSDNVLDACRLKVAPEQERFVAPVARSLAEAYADPDKAWPRLVYDGDRLVAFVMAFFDVRFGSVAPLIPRTGSVPDSGGWPSPRTSRARGTGASPWTPSVRRSSGADRSA